MRDLGKPGGANIYMRPDGTLLCSYDVPSKPPGRMARDQLPNRSRPQSMDPRGARGDFTDDQEIDQFLRERLAPEDYATLLQMLDAQGEDESGDMPDELDVDRRMTSRPFEPPFSGGQDSAQRRSFAEKYPHFGRVKNLG